MSRTKEEQKEYSKQYYLKNKNKILLYQKKYKKENPCVIYERNKKYVNKNKDHVSEYMKNYRLKNKEIIANRLKEFNSKQKNKDLKKTRYNKDKELISNNYVKMILRNKGFKTEQITPELIELKRITLKTKRLCQQLKS